MFEKGDAVRLNRDVNGLKKGTVGVFRDYIDHLTGEVNFGGSKWEIIAIDDLELVSSGSGISDRPTLES